MSKGINKVILIGNLGADPEVRYMPQGGAVANMTIATSESWTDKATNQKKEQTEWHRVVIYQRLAEIRAQAGRDGFIAGANDAAAYISKKINEGDKNINLDAGAAADKYANQTRQPAKAGT